MGSILSRWLFGHRVHHEDMCKTCFQQIETTWCRLCWEVYQRHELEKYKKNCVHEIQASVYRYKEELKQTSEYRYKEELKQMRHELEQYKKNFEHEFQASIYRYKEELKQKSEYKEELKKTRHGLEQYKKNFEQFQASEYKEELEKTRHELEQYKRNFELFQTSEYKEELNKTSEYKEELKKTRHELEQYKRNFEQFQARMAFEASVDMGSSGALCEDINNPCRETELKKMYDKLRLQMLSKYMMEIKKKSKTDKTINETKEKEKLKSMLQEVFTKAQHDMTKKKEDFLSFLQVDHKKEEGEKGEVKKTQHKSTKQQTKKLKYIELALQNLQMIIFHEEARHLQTVYKQPDPLCALADECYKVGCLLALHNPPLLLDWKNKGPSDYLPPIKMEDTSVNTAS